MRPGDKQSLNEGSAARHTQRIDKWLWYARLFKSRSLAAKFAESGKIRLKNGDTRAHLSKPSQTVRVGDVLTFPYGGQIRVLRVCAAGTRRGPAPEARLLYEDLTPLQQRPEEGGPLTIQTPSRPRGAGRPTKKDRRDLDRFQGPDSGDGDSQEPKLT